MNVLPEIWGALSGSKVAFAKGFLIMGSFYGTLLAFLHTVKAPIVSYDIMVGLTYSTLMGIYFAVKEHSKCSGHGHDPKKGTIMGTVSSALGPFCAACPACVPEAYLALSAAAFVIPKGLFMQIGPWILLAQIVGFTLMLHSIKSTALHGMNHRSPNIGGIYG